MVLIREEHILKTSFLYVIFFGAETAKAELSLTCIAPASNMVTGVTVIATHAEIANRIGTLFCRSSDKF